MHLLRRNRTVQQQGLALRRPSHAPQLHQCTGHRKVSQRQADEGMPHRLARGIDEALVPLDVVGIRQ